jgi:hypothetical protein
LLLPIAPCPFSKSIFQRIVATQLLRKLGPGLITGASDDDPSGIGTYSQAGAQPSYGGPCSLLNGSEEFSKLARGRVGTQVAISKAVIRHADAVPP